MPLRLPLRLLAAIALVALVGGVGVGGLSPAGLSSASASAIRVDAAATSSLGSAVLSLAKMAAVSQPQLPGASFVYTLGFGCSSLTTGCVDAVLTDEIPAPLVIVGTPSVVGVTSSTVTVTGNRMSVAFADPVANTDPARTGIPDGTTGTVQVTVQVPNTLNRSWDGATLTNTAELAAVNAPSRSASAAVSLRVPTDISVSLTTAWAPATAAYDPGALSELALTVANTSNVAAASLTVAEPVRPGAATNPFNFYNLSGLGAVTFPQGADRVSVDVRAAGQWSLGTASATASLPADIRVQDIDGLRFTFSASTGTTLVAAGTAGRVLVSLAQRATNRADGTQTLTAGGVRESVAQAAVVTAQGPGTSPEASANQTIAPLTATVAVTNSFSVPQIPAGQSSTSTISARNTSTGALSSLIVSQPTTAGSFFSTAILFREFDSATTRWPQGATDATLTWFVNTGVAPAAQTGITQATGMPQTPTLATGQHITGFEIRYTGTIVVAATATLGVIVDTTTAAAINSTGATSYPDAVRASGTNSAGSSEATASADLAVWVPTITANLRKNIRADVVYSGGTSTVQLATITPTVSSVVRPNSLTITEPEVVGSSSFWNAFDAVAIGSTTVPKGSRLTIEYFDGASWQSMRDSRGVIDATIATQVLRANLSTLLPAGVAAASITGLRFTFTNSIGFALGTEVTPAIVFQARTLLRDGSGAAASGIPADSTTWASYRNCALVEVAGTIVTGSSATGSSATNSNATNTVANSAVSCANATIIAPQQGAGGPGTAPVIVNKIIDQATALAQSHQTVGATLLWGVQSTGFAFVTVTDNPNPSAATVASTMFQAVDLTRIEGITPDQDPLIRWDEVANVELYSASADAWVSISDRVCNPSRSCVGNLPSYTLTAAESADSIAVRITFRESAERGVASAISGDPSAPPVDTGVANLPAGFYNGASVAGRAIHLSFELRNRVRDSSSTMGPWVTAQQHYNRPTAGVVSNTVAVTATPIPDFSSANTPITDTASDDITLLQSPPAVTTVKTVSPSSLTIPQPEIAQESYPTATYTVRARNAGASNASTLRLTDPAVCGAGAQCVFGNRADPFAGASYEASSNPFEKLSLTGIRLETPPTALASRTEVHLWHRAATGMLSSTGPFTQAETEAMTPIQLADVIGITAQFVGESGEGATITPGSQATITLTTQLRQRLRSNQQPVLAGMAVNTVLGGIEDSVLYPSSYPQSSAATSLALNDGFVAVATSKDIAPASLLIGAPNVTVTVDLRAHSAGTVAPKTLSITEESATFFNAVTAVAAAIPTMPTGADRVEIAAKVGGIWITTGPRSASAAALPTTVNPAMIDGIMATFTRSDGGEFSATDDGGLLLIATLRSTLRDGSGPVTSISSSTAMPGETVPGRISNTETARVTHNQLTATATARDSIDLGDASAEVAIEKTSVGQTFAGREIPFSLRIRNTGTGYLTNPMITDMLPADGSLSFVASDLPRYSTTPEGTLTTAATDVVRNYDAASRRITFTFPPGARLAPGETYTVTFSLAVTPGLSAGTEIINAVQFSDDRPITACTALNPQGGRTAALADATCITDNSVSILSGGSFFAFKGVKSGLGGATNTLNAAIECHPDAEGYYRYPCAADSSIGTTDEWTLRMINGGTIGSRTLSAIDRLPKVGDQGIVDRSERGSLYTPRFNGDVSFHSATAGIGFRWYFTTDDTVCTSDIYPSEAPCAANAWKPASALVRGREADVTGIKTVFDFSGLPSGLLPPAAVLSVNYSTTNVPSVAAGDGRAPVAVPLANLSAWSSFGYYPSYASGALPPSPEEPIKAGVRLATSSLNVTKLMAGTQVSRAPSAVTASVACTIMGARIDMGASATITLDVANNFATRLDSIPQGARCTITEDGVVGWFGEQQRNGPQTVEVTATAASQGAAPKTAQATLVNTYSPTLLAVNGPTLIRALANTGSVMSTALAAYGVVAVLVGAALLLLRRRRT